jgi:hypothetical protein
MKEFSFVHFAYVIIINTGFRFDFRMGQSWKRLIYFFFVCTYVLFGMEEVFNLNYGKTLRLL